VLLRWEHAIRADERAVVEFDVPREIDPDPGYVDEIAVERALYGDPVPLTRAEQVEAVRRLVGRGALLPRIAELLHISIDAVRHLLVLVNGADQGATAEGVAA
jgi:hypothetical protein